MNKIGWCDLTFNPVWGCRNDCSYCYARKIASFRYNQMADKEYKYMYYKDEICRGEFANRLRHFVPTFIESNFNKKFPKKTQRIFVGSMSEIYYWRREWVEEVIEKIKQYPQHTFQFLTKYPRIYSKYVLPNNCWLGMTITKEEDVDKNWGYFYNENNRCFFSVEPFLDRINPESLECIDWVIIGAETGNRKGKIIPKREWIEEIINFCRNKNIPLFLKDSIYKGYPDLSIMKEFPNGS
jgi:protein gp37